MATHFNTDYYAVLGISPLADEATIKKAYRTKAIESHPDRHPPGQAETWNHAMQQINAAFEILSNPEKRRWYDEARRNTETQYGRQQAEADMAQAQQNADNYPKDFKEFESWLDRLTRDFTDAEYNAKGGVNNSVSGFIFAVVGGIAGLIIYGELLAHNALTINLGLYAPCGIGVFLGVCLHRVIGNSLRKPDCQDDTVPLSSSKAQPAQTFENNAILNCPQCGGQLRLPNHCATVRCPRCEHTFSHEPLAKKVNPSAMTSASDGESGGSEIVAAAVLGLVAFGVLSFVCTTQSSGDFGEPEFEMNWPVIIIGTIIAVVIGYKIGNKSSNKPTS